jgi:predicted enzyme related to lactoylglutathione lyase
MGPTSSNGKICYVELPANDVRQSADFYERVFGWRTRRRGDGSVAFDDGVGQVSGTWVTGRPAAASPGLMVYVMVDSVAATLDAVVAHGGEVARPPCPAGGAVIAQFRDPAGNLLGLYQEPSR